MNAVSYPFLGLLYRVSAKLYGTIMVSKSYISEKRRLPLCLKVCLASHISGCGPSYGSLKTCCHDEDRVLTSRVYRCVNTLTSPDRCSATTQKYSWTLRKKLNANDLELQTLFEQWGWGGAILRGRNPGTKVYQRVKGGFSPLQSLNGSPYNCGCQYYRHHS